MKETVEMLAEKINQQLKKQEGIEVSRFRNKEEEEKETY